MSRTSDVSDAMREMERGRAVRFARLAADAARKDLAEIRAKIDGMDSRDHWYDHGLLMAHVGILVEKIDALLGGDA